MDVESAIRGRRSIRAYRAEPVPPALVSEILDAARWAPSWADTQDWNVYVITGDALERVKEGLRLRLQTEAPPTPDLPMPAREWPEPLQRRIGHLVEAQRERLAAASRSGAGATANPTFADLFGAPTLLVFAIDEELAPVYASFDAGLLVQTILLAAHDRGLGSCVMAMAVRYPDALREVLPETGGKRFLIAVALGYPDAQAPINDFERPRVQLKELVTWVS